MVHTKDAEGASGTIALLGRTNAGKSLLLNRLLGEKLAIVSPRAQTTRTRILGIYNGPEGQLVFVDTPGLHGHDGRSQLNRFMEAELAEATRNVNAVALVIDAEAALAGKHSSLIDPRPAELAKRVHAEGRPIVLVVNKIDRIKDKTRLMPLLSAWDAVVPFASIVPISALTGDGVDRLLAELSSVVPKGPPRYPEDELTDRSERFLLAEIVREQLFLRLRAELPYSTAVEIEHWRERGTDVVVDAVILVERESQKRIVVGRGGEMIRSVGSAARQEATRFLGRPIHLKLFVKVVPGWTSSPETMERLGYRVKKD